MKARAVMITFQNVRGAKVPTIQLDDLVPNDAQNLQYDGKGSDNMVTVRNVKGISEELAKIFPESDGKFAGGFNWDKETGEFIGGTIMIEFPLPSARK